MMGSKSDAVLSRGEAVRQQTWDLLETTLREYSGDRTPGRIDGSHRPLDEGMGWDEYVDFIEEVSSRAGVSFLKSAPKGFLKGLLFRLRTPPVFYPDSMSLAEIGDHIEAGRWPSHFTEVKS